MTRIKLLLPILGVLLTLVTVALLPADRSKDGERPFGLPARIPWTTSRITGTPEPPPPYRVQRVFPKLTFNNPLLLSRIPGTNRFVVGEQYGRLYSFPNDPACKQADLFLDLRAELHSWGPAGKVRGVGAVYGLAFHPHFARNRYCYVCYVLDGKNGEQLPEGTRVSRFRVRDSQPPRIDPASEKVLITWLAGGHNGGCLEFGPDGYLYISTGDAADPNPPDRLDTGQDVSDLLSSILRIDVDHEEGGKPYRVPPDNPFVKTAKARPEIWAYGFRNPWKMSFDRKTGELWVGDVGWELWEMVYRIQRGGNYGWSVMEGRQPVRPNSRRGPTPILPPTIDFSHTEAASITGGSVYRGKRLEDLIGCYVCGDWVTGRLWGTRFEGDRMVSHRELARSPLHIVAFGEDADGELYFVHYDAKGTIHQLVPNPAAQGEPTRFPRKLSETGLFASVAEHRPAAGVIPFSVQAAQWADHAASERLVALPGTSSVQMYDRVIPIPGGFYSGRIFFPKGAALVRTFSLEMERGKPSSRRRLETQVLHYDGSEWHGYSYRWNDAQTDAELVAASGAEQTLTIKDAHAPGGRRRQTWHFAGRSECLVCHNPWGGYALAFTPGQLDRDHSYNGVVDNQLRSLVHAGVLKPVKAPQDDGGPQPPAKLVDPEDTAASLEERARSYLHVNCSHCHQFGAGGTADIDLRRDMSLEQTRTLEVRPAQGSFEIADARILASGDPYRSILYYRMAKLGRGRMPHIGSEIVDERGLNLIHDWIRQLPIRKDERALIERLCALDEPAILAHEREQWSRNVAQTAHELARARGRHEPSVEDRRQAETQLKKQAAAEARQRAAARKEALGRLLSSPSSALVLARALHKNEIPAFVREQVLATAMSLPPQIRDLFEPFVPDEQRLKRLGPNIQPEQILSLRGNADRGRELFFNTSLTQCASCHRLDGKGTDRGPDLSHIGKKYTRAQILESILDPSKTIDPAYAGYLVETSTGRVYNGLLVKKTAKEVVLREAATGNEVHIPAEQVDSMAAQKKSLMPEQLLRDLSAEQAADLLELLSSRK
jgi:putative heme-binding domain-containing protein